ncbi:MULTISPECIES: M48 family metallopeptidase [Anaerostipes]|uniref:Zinc metalloprotease n=1 Tax=Anaerostipes butyraticus TaxID=645466 RepID=A0A916Q6D2_9FIRM|nr:MULTISPECIES: SprT family zinc-dependent metalloprotease [Anaerostipes]GFO85182.1 zinc metalloprotease [Anaerostipes butyraticus]HJC82327.1 M48 family metallopeptidase [Candidatus Anaerostipes avicola]
MKEIQICGIPARIDRRSIKNINIYIKPPNGDILITAPKRAGEEVILDFIQKKSDWIVKNHEKMIRKKSSHFSAVITDEQKNLLMEKIHQFSEKWEPVMGVHAQSFTLRSMKTIWGSCSTKTGRIRINLQLAVYPDDCIEYVVVHELCHLLEPSHNTRFHQLMTKFLPDWKERKRLLNQQ